MPTILVADDVKDMRNLLVQIVESAGYESVEASNGAEVLAAIKDNDNIIDLILLDIGMPDMDGIEALKKIRKIDESVKVCLVSGSKEKITVEKAINAGGNDYVVKPVDVAIILQKIKKLLGEKIDESFSTVQAKLIAKLPAIPLDLDFWVVELSEIGLKFESPVPLKEGERIEIIIPKLSNLLSIEFKVTCEIESISQAKPDPVIVSCLFYAVHDTMRSKIRSLTQKGKPLLED